MNTMLCTPCHAQWQKYMRRKSTLKRSQQIILHSKEAKHWLYTHTLQISDTFHMIWFCAVSCDFLAAWQQTARASSRKFNIYFSMRERKLFWKIESHFTYSIKRCAKEANEAPDMKTKWRRRRRWIYDNGVLRERVSVFAFYSFVCFPFSIKISSPYAVYGTWFM